MPPPPARVPVRRRALSPAVCGHRIAHLSPPTALRGNVHAEKHIMHTNRHRPPALANPSSCAYIVPTAPTMLHKSPHMLPLQISPPRSTPRSCVITNGKPTGCISRNAEGVCRQPIRPYLYFISLSERILASTERPAAITHRRLEQAGYDQLDSLDYLAAEDMTFLLKFVYKSQLLGPAVCPLL